MATATAHGLSEDTEKKVSVSEPSRPVVERKSPPWIFRLGGVIVAGISLWMVHRYRDPEDEADFKQFLIEL